MRTQFSDYLSTETVWQTLLEHSELKLIKILLNRVF